MSGFIKGYQKSRYSKCGLMKKDRIIIAIGGYSGSGKSTISQFCRNRGYTVISVSGLVREYIKKRVSNFSSLNKRSKLSKGVKVISKDKYLPAKLVYEKFKNLHTNKNVIIDGIRSLRDLAFLDKENVKIIFVYAPFKTRFERIKNERKERISQKFLLKRDFIDISFGLGEVIRNADFLILNDSNTTKSELIKRFLHLEAMGFKSIKNKDSIFKKGKIPTYIIKEVREYEARVKRLGK